MVQLPAAMGKGMMCADQKADGQCGGCVTPSAKNKYASSDNIDNRFRNYLIRTNLDIFLIGIVLACYHAHYALVYAESTDGHGGSNSTSTGDHSEEEILSEEKREVYAVLFPWFAEIVGVFVYYVLSRYAHAIPYTAIMFIIGAFIGFSVQRVNVNAITFSAETWINIEGEVILLVFLPGLLYLDSYNIDVHLFITSFTQLLTFAFPMVLAGTSLTALVACYVLDYGWSFDLCMTFGSILAATDPVAVAVLLNELGAPPRLKVSESLFSFMFVQARFLIIIPHLFFVDACVWRITFE